ncbi:hypothetical protein DXB92_04910 [Ruminococcus sp. OM06-36AC]|nr:hypothetical protein DXB92_04910 [Ruminococcus sp. OM06-36AC]
MPSATAQTAGAGTKSNTRLPIQFYYNMNRTFLQDAIWFSRIFVTSYRFFPLEADNLYKLQLVLGV